MSHTSMGGGGVVTLARFPSKIRIPSDHKICTNKECLHHGHPQPIQNFGKSHSSADGYRSWCIECDRAYSKKANARKADAATLSLIIGSEPMERKIRTSSGRIKRLSMDAETLEKALDMLRRGYKLVVVAKRLSVSTTTLSKNLKTYGNSKS